MPTLPTSSSPTARWRLERTKTPLVATLALLVGAVAGCSSAADDLESGTRPGADDASGSGSDEGRGSTDGADDGADDGPGGTAAEPEADSSGGEEPEDEGSGDGQVPPASAGCPDDWPRGWLFCEDFETIKDPLDSFSQYASGDGAFVVDSEAGAMRADFREGVEDAGFVLVSFGASPIAPSGGPTHAAEEHFDEIYWRVNVRHQEGWPDVGPGWLGRTTAFASDNWSQALVAQLRSAGADTTLEAVPLSCVVGESVTCQGYDDESGLHAQDTMQGSTPIFSRALSGQWHCVEAHVKLDDVDADVANGVFEFWVDGKSEAKREDVDWRGGWAEYGLNAVTLENFWPGGATGELTRWMDDIVVSTERIGCD